MHANNILSFSDVTRLDEYNITANNKLAFDVMEKEFGIAPIMRASEMTTCGKIDQLSMVVYLTQIRNALTEKDTPAGNEQAFITMKGKQLNKTICCLHVRFLYMCIFSLVSIHDLYGLERQTLL